MMQANSNRRINRDSRVIMHIPGHHGNFLQRTYDIATGKIKPIDIFNEHGAAHNYRDEIPHETWNNICPGETFGERPHKLSGNDVSINYTSKHSLITVYHTFKTRKNTGICLLDDNQIDRAKSLQITDFKDRALFVDSNYFEDNKSWLKAQFSIVENMVGQQDRFAYQFPLEAFYTDFIDELKSLIAWNNDAYVYDVSTYHEQFMELRKPILTVNSGAFYDAYQEHLQDPAPIPPMNIIGYRYKNYIK